MCRTVSAQISQDHIATAFHFFISKRGAELAADLAASFCWKFEEKYGCFHRYRQSIVDKKQMKQVTRKDRLYELGGNNKCSKTTVRLSLSTSAPGAYLGSIFHWNISDSGSGFGHCM
jgi:hypothetical protein